MTESSARREFIRNLIASNKIHTQEELIRHLSDNGVEVTQATLSRDIRALGAVKVHDPENGFFYHIPAKAAPKRNQYIFNVEFSGQICVVHSLPGYAPAVAAIIDRNGIPGVMGTVAGDDTVIVVLRTDADQARIIKSLESLQ